MIIYVISVMLIITAIFLIYYWIDFFLRKGVQVIQEEWYIKFQKAFPVADMWTTVCALLGVVGLLTEQNYVSLFSLLAASSLIFLALMDITFNVENKLYNLVGTSNEMKCARAENTEKISLKCDSFFNTALFYPFERFMENWFVAVMSVMLPVMIVGANSGSYIGYRIYKRRDILKLLEKWGNCGKLPIKVLSSY